MTDRVMGGVSIASMGFRNLNERRALCVEDEVRLDNESGFIQVNLDLTAQGLPLDARGFDGVRLVVCGNGEVYYHLHLETADSKFPWQAYRASFTAGPDWREVRLPFRAFAPYRLIAPLDPARLTQLGVVAIGHAFRAQRCLAEVGWYRVL